MKRLAFLIYNIRSMNRKQYARFRRYVSQITGRSQLSLDWDAMVSSLRYNISPIEYFHFRFWEKDKTERSKWAGTGYMYEYQLKMNPRNKREVLNDKRLFLKEYSQFVKHLWGDLDSLRADPSLAGKLIASGERLVIKSVNGQCGKMVKILDTAGLTHEKLIKVLEENDFGLAEEYIIQHPAMHDLSPTAINTIRILTQLDRDNKVHILGCRIRISVDSPVDNLAAGNIAAIVDEDTGIVTGAGIFSDIMKEDVSVHPLTNAAITGFQVPFWAETMKLAREAALYNTGNRSIGWDIAITADGPDIIEGNHNWCKLLWQLPEHRGMKEELLKYV